MRLQSPHCLSGWLRTLAPFLALGPCGYPHRARLLSADHCPPGTKRVHVAGAAHHFKMRQVGVLDVSWPGLMNARVVVGPKKNVTHTLTTIFSHEMGPEWHIDVGAKMGETRLVRDRRARVCTAVLRPLAGTRGRRYRSNR